MTPFVILVGVDCYLINELLLFPIYFHAIVAILSSLEGSEGHVQESGTGRQGGCLYEQRHAIQGIWHRLVRENQRCSASHLYVTRYLLLRDYEGMVW